MVDFLARSMFWHPMFQVLNVVDGVPMKLEGSKSNSILVLVFEIEVSISCGQVSIHISTKSL